jgi:hypothetical protein
MYGDALDPAATTPMANKSSGNEDLSLPLRNGIFMSCSLASALTNGTTETGGRHYPTPTLTDWRREAALCSIRPTTDRLRFHASIC